MAGLQESLPSSSAPSFKEKVAYVGTAVDEKSILDPDKSSDGYNDEDEKPLYVNGEPVITSGRDVSKYLVDVRDDEDPPFTFRSFVLGTMVGGLGAALYQVCMHASESVSAVPRPFASRSIFSSPSKLESRQCFFCSLFTRLVFFGQPFSHGILG